jgi:hypothetical protein
MKLLKIIILTLCFSSIFSCKNKNMGKDIISENISQNNYSKNDTNIEMIYSLEYYKNRLV